MKNIDILRELYNKGFKCIRYEDGERGEFTVYCKNFEKEKIYSIQTNNQDEIQEIKDYIDNNTYS
ncbi:hypothetical protein L21TH_2113 [Caldisalinibacter kiritimatiensis]|uniref:DUF5659 domain-containing protein n=2 Tax=Caldisalinibacter kiritimatiensis TaxID=1304284 RepID=R1CSX8_9FIRM|nr:hypothetical protein L21TH_2113 [Caldisalinibacter kiritimatiensis]